MEIRNCGTLLCYPLCVAHLRVTVWHGTSIGGIPTHSTHVKSWQDDIFPCEAATKPPYKPVFAQPPGSFVPHLGLQDITVTLLLFFLTPTNYFEVLCFGRYPASHFVTTTRVEGWILEFDLSTVSRVRWCLLPHTPTLDLPYASGRELYPLIYEKAFAKHFGGYDLLDGGNILVALQAFTGDPVFHLSRQDSGGWKVFTLRTERDHAKKDELGRPKVRLGAVGAVE